AADRALRILAQFQLAEAHLERVEEEQAPNQRLSRSEQQFHGFGCLDYADYAGKNSQHASFGAAGHQSGGRRLRIKATIAGPSRHTKHRCLAFEPEDTAVDVRLT